MTNAQRYLELDLAARKAASAWLDTDTPENLAAMCQAENALAVAKEAGWHIVRLADGIVDDMMARSVFGTADRVRDGGAK